jgi:hypothetical protein
VDRERSGTKDSHSIGKDLGQVEDLQMLAPITNSSFKKAELTSSVVGVVEFEVIATFRERGLGVGRVNAGVPQRGLSVACGVFGGVELGGEVEFLNGGAESQGCEPGALVVVAGKDSGGGGGCESEDDGGELHLDGGGGGGGW